MAPPDAPTAVVVLVGTAARPPTALGLVGAIVAFLTGFAGAFHAVARITGHG